MKREIKFRAWDNLEKRMLIVCRLGLRGFSHETWSASPISNKHHSNESLELMQFTGLTDKNGKEIYEGDIIKKAFSINYNSKSIQQEMIYIAKFERHKFHSAFELVNIDKTAKNHTLSYNEELIIIGNIYENPELLK